jgi:hypothetical protein
MSLFTLRTGATSHPEDSVLQLITDAIYSSGVITKAASTTHFLIQAQGTPDMTVKVKAGRAYIKGASGNAYPVLSDTDTSVAIGANGSGSTRVDAVVLYIDKGASANSDASNIAKLMVVQGTISAPSDGTIQSAVGASNPFTRLADVSVSSGATSIVSGNITDQRAIAKFQFSDMVTAPDNILPWHIDIDVFMTCIGQVNFDSIPVDNSFIHGGSKFASAQNAEINFDIVLAAGTWTIELLYYKDSNLGIFTIQLDGTTVGTIDSYSGGFTKNNRSSITGIAVATTGKKRLRITNPTKNASATAYFLNLQHIQLRRTV